ncbi:MAG: DUF4202 family protein [Nanoarchaeota archaeon]
MLAKVIDFVNKTFSGKSASQILHFERTVHWIKHFRPSADEPLLIAAYSHDIERGNRDPKIAEMIVSQDSGFLDEKFLKYHQEKGAEIIGEFLAKNNYSSDNITRVKMLVSKHEVGGNEDQNLLKDCDSMSYFETQVAGFIKNKVPELGKQKVKEKFDWMYERITSSESKKIAKPLYEKAIASLNAI